MVPGDRPAALKGISGLFTSCRSRPATRPRGARSAPGPPAGPDSALRPGLPPPPGVVGRWTRHRLRAPGGVAFLPPAWSGGSRSAPPLSRSGRTHPELGRWGPVRSWEGLVGRGKGRSAGGLGRAERRFRLISSSPGSFSRALSEDVKSKGEVSNHDVRDLTEARVRGM